MFPAQVLLSFTIGGLAIALQTLLAERVADKWRGVILTIPTTMAFGLLFVGLTKQPEDAAQATIIIPASLGIDYFFPVCFAYLSRRNVWVALCASYAIWLLGAMLLLRLPPIGLVESVALYFTPLVVIAYLLAPKPSQQHKLIPVPFTVKHIAIRSVFGGLIVALIVVLAHSVGNSWAGVFATFPAAFSATLLIYYFVHGQQIIPTIARSLFFPGAIGFVLYATAIYITAPHVGIWWSTLIAYGIVIAFSLSYTLLANKYRALVPKN